MLKMSTRMSWYEFKPQKMRFANIYTRLLNSVYNVYSKDVDKTEHKLQHASQTEECRN